MNTQMLLTVGAGDLKSLLIGFLVILVVLACVGGLIYAIETWVMKTAIPTPVKLVIGLVLVVLVIIWAIGAVGGG